MGLFGIFKSKSKDKSESKPASSPGSERDAEYAAIWNSPDGIHLGFHHVSATTMHIMETAKYCPSRRVLISQTTSTSDPAPRYSVFPVPEEIGSADQLINFIFHTPIYRVVGGVDERLRQQLDAAFK